ncbi:MAG: WecB/TagA/CpsF family glycosyltransferase [Tateyamaria sp.]
MADLSARFLSQKGFCLATLNLDHVVKLKRSENFRKAYAQQTHVTADGRPIVWLSSLAGHPVDLLPGSGIMTPMIELAEKLQVPVAFFGSDKATLEQASKHLTARFPRLKIVSLIAPLMGFDPEGAQADAFIETLKQSGAGLVFIALGAPKQEIFAHRAYTAAPQIGFASIGAGVDFIAGTQTRAPRLVRALAAEWLWRLAGDPKRLMSRYLACFAILPALTRRALQRRFAKSTDVQAR